MPSLAVSAAGCDQFQSTVQQGLPPLSFNSFIGDASDQSSISALRSPENSISKASLILDSEFFFDPRAFSSKSTPGDVGPAVRLAQLGGG